MTNVTSTNNPACQFLNALFAADESVALPLFDNVGAPCAYDTSLEGNLYTTPLTQAGVAFVFKAVNVGDDYPLQPTVVLTKDNLALAFWAFSTLETAETVQPLVAALDMGVDEQVPCAGTNGWQMVECDPQMFYQLSDLIDAFVPVDAAQTTYGDAVVLSPYNEADYHIPMVVTLGARTDSKTWKPEEMQLGAFIASLCQHRVGKKDGPAFVVGDMVPGQRLKNSVKTIYGIGLDIDTGTPTEVVDAALLKLGCTAVRYTTHSHNKTSTEFKKDKLVKFVGHDEFNDEIIRTYLRDDQQWDEGIVRTANFEGIEHNEKGIVVQVSHAPMPKHRIVIPLAIPFEIGKEGKTQKEATDKWAKVPAAISAQLGLPFDKSCVDPSRLFYFPRHNQNKDFSISLFGAPNGRLFDWTSLELENPLEKYAAEIDRGKSKSVTPEGRELGKWSVGHAMGFQIADLIEDHASDRLRGSASQGFAIECPFDEDHSNHGDRDDVACFVVNAGMGSSDIFTISCRHESCRNKTNLDMLGKMVADGWFDREVLDEDRYMAIVVNAQGEPEPKPEPACVFEFSSRDDLIEAMNKKCALVRDGNNRMFAFWDEDGVVYFNDKANAKIGLAQYQLVKWRKDGAISTPEYSDGYPIWLKSPKRREYDAVVLDPDTANGNPKHLNLWAGFAVKPEPGDWSLLRNHLFENVCQRNEGHFSYLLDWLSQMVFEPQRKPEVATVLRGKSGVGKTKLSAWLAHIIGDRHSIFLNSKDGLTGRFNGHLEPMILIAAEEAFFAGDHEVKNKLKDLISNPKLTYERKNKDMRQGASYLRVLMTTNEKWAVPVGDDDRRYFVLDVGDEHEKDHPYFAAIDAQMKAGGAAAMLHDLLERGMTFAKLGDPPMTKAKFEQIRLGMGQDDKWLASVLEYGEFPAADEDMDVEWPLEGGDVPKSAVFNSYCKFVHGFRSTPSPVEVGRYFQQQVPGVGTTRPKVMGMRVWHYSLPPLAEARAAFEAAHPGYKFTALPDDGENVVPLSPHLKRTG